MSDYRAPVKDMRFVMDEIAGFNELAQLPAFAEATPDLADAILDEAAKFAGEVIAPLNRIGDQQGCQLGADGVRTPPGWKEAYSQYRAAGWNGITLPTEFGGQGLPNTLGIAATGGNAINLRAAAPVGGEINPLAIRRKLRLGVDTA